MIEEKILFSFFLCISFWGLDRMRKLGKFPKTPEQLANALHSWEFSKTGLARKNNLKWTNKYILLTMSTAYQAESKNATFLYWVYFLLKHLQFSKQTSKQVRANQERCLMFYTLKWKLPDTKNKKKTFKYSVSNISKHIIVYYINWTVANNTVLGSKEIKKT